MNKIALFLGIITSARCGALPPAAFARAVVDYEDIYPQYNYGYAVQDPLTGDAKNQQESRDGEVVRGRYSLIEPDGTLRIVTYMADSTGFHAVVEKQGVSISHGVIAPAQTIVAQPPQHVIQPQPVQVQPHPVQVIQPQPPSVPVQIENPAIVEIPEHAPAPVEIPQPVPTPVETPQQPVPFPEFPQPTPAPVEVEQPQPAPQPVQPPRPQPIQPEPPRPQETFDDAEIIGRRADAGAGRGSIVSFRSSRNGQHDFNFSF